MRSSPNQADATAAAKAKPPLNELGVDRENTRGNLQLKKRFSGVECAGLGVLRCQRNGGGGRAIRPQRFCPVQNRADAAAAAVAAGGAR